ncbi:60S ribosomal protein L29 [Myotis brandtii]|uniref:60S ribosomal protein L29 n=1 Tax=Myotis brandtii TaxID=109478 RepID=S7PAI9_MYOBR|nr:60S ribosomal protein L29 [Myotis brandtii]
MSAHPVALEPLRSPRCQAQVPKGWQLQAQATCLHCTSCGSRALAKPKFPNGGSRKLRQLAYIARPKLGKRAGARISQGLRLYGPKSTAKAEAQTKPRSSAAAPAQIPAEATQ